MNRLLRKFYEKLPWVNDINNINSTMADHERQLWERIGALEHGLAQHAEQLWSRIGGLESTVYHQSGLGIVTGRLDVRLHRLEVLLYYANPTHMAMLDEDQKAFIQKLWTDYGYESHKNALFPPDPYYGPVPSSPKMAHEGYHDENLEVPPVLEEGGACYIMLNGHKLFLRGDTEWAEGYIRQAYLTYEATDSPHTYLRPQDDGVDVPQGAILADIGAAEGFFGIKYLDRCKKVYFFETDPEWLGMLRRTCAPYGDKVEIVEGFVGDQPGNINLDDFFGRRDEKPDFIKMDIEGAEGSALRSMPKLLDDTSPLTLLICTYHRQEDWDNYYAMLHDRFAITSSNGYYWHIANMQPPFLRRGLMRAVKKA